MKTGRFWLVKVLSVVLAAALTLAMGAEAAPAQKKIRLGVFQFENKVGNLNQQHADAVLDIITQVLANSRNISVMERAQLAKVGAEMRLGQSGLVDVETAAELGRIAGLQYILLGSITGFDKRAAAMSLGSLGSASETDTITLDARIIDTSTAQIILAISEMGSSKNEVSTFGTLTAEGVIAGAESRAIRDAVFRLAFTIRKELAGETPRVIEARDKEAIIDVGSNFGATQDALYLVYMEGKSLHDFDGALIGREVLPLAAMRVRNADLRHSTCVYATGKGSNPRLVRRGDLVKPLSEEEARNIKYVKDRPSESHSDWDALLNGTQPATPAAPGIDSTPTPAASPAPAPAESAQKGGPAPAQAGFDPNHSTDSKVIDTYPLSSGERNSLGILQRSSYNQYRSGRYKNAYEGFVRAAESQPNVNYLSAYWAAEAANKLRRQGDARTWVNKALEINPNYVPAQKLKEQLEKSSKPAKKQKK